MIDIAHQPSNTKLFSVIHLREKMIEMYKSNMAKIESAMKNNKHLLICKEKGIGYENYNRYYE